jgi:PAS domain S-box-containing protein
MLQRRSIRWYLFALVLGVALPLIGVLLAEWRDNAQRDELRAAEASLQLARIAAEETSRFVADTRTLLVTLAAGPGMRALTTADCDPIFEQFSLWFPRYTNLGLVDEQGTSVCSTQPVEASVSPAQAEWFAAVAHELAFYVGRPHVGRASKTWVVVLAQPVRDAEGRLRGVLIASLNLLDYQAAALGAPLPPGALITIVDSDGTVVARSSEAAAQVGHPAADASTVAAAWQRKSGTLRTSERDGGMLWGFTPVEGAPWMVMAGIPAVEMLTAAQRTSVRNGLIAAVLLPLLGLWAWWLSRRIIEPMRRIAGVAHRVGEGASGLRADVDGPLEICEVAQRLNDMLDRREAAESELRKTNQTLALVQEASAGGVWEWDIAADTLTYSHRFKALLGFQDDDNFAATFSFSDALHPDHRQRVLAALERQLDHDVPFDEEFQLRCGNGDYRWFRGRGLALRDESGNAVRFAGSISDISQRKRTELDLRDSEQRFELALRGAADGIWDWDIAHNRYHMSAQYKALLGYRDDEIESSRRTFLQRLHPDDGDRVVAAVDAHLERREPYDTEYRLRCKDGSYRWFRGRGQAVWDADGRPQRMAGSVSDVTARKIAESALRESEAKYRLLLETLTDTVLMVDDGNRIVFANRALTDCFGYTPAEIAGEELAMLQPERLRGDRAQGMQHLLASGEMRMKRLKETVARHRDGHEFPVEISVSRLQYGGKGIFVGCVRDISAQKRAEAELRQSERLFRDMADSSPALVWMAGPDGGCFYFNRPWFEFTGRRIDQEAGDGWLDGVHSEDVGRCRREHSEAIAARRTFRIEYRLRRRDGEYRWLLDQGVPRFDEHAQFMGYLGTCVDITTHVEADDHIRRLSDMYSVLSQVNGAIARAKDQQRLFERVCQIASRFGNFIATWIGLVDEQRHCVRASAVGGESYGYFDRIEVPLDANDPRSRGPVASAVLGNRHEVWNDFWADERSSPWRNTPPARFVSSVAAFPLRRAGRVVGVFVAYSDKAGFFDVEIIHLLLDLANNLSFALDSLAAEARRQKAEEEIRELNATLEQRVAERTLSLEAANKELEAFSYSVSHDLRAPLRSIGGFSDILLESYGERLEQDGRNYLLRVKQASQRMTRLINDLLNLARIARSDLKCRPLDLSALAEEVAAEMRSADSQRDVELVIAPNLIANADPVLMRSVFENLLSNAWKFTAKRAHARIEVGTGERSGQTFFFVRDNGAGFNMAYADKLFAPFQRLHSEHEFSGTGVGLATVQRIVHRHHGHIWAEAAEGEGACFYFTLAA